MASLKSLMQENLNKSKGNTAPIIQTPAVKKTGKLKEQFNAKVSPELITESEICAMMEEGMPYIHKDEPMYEEYIEEAARIKRTNPALYAKMKAWD